MEKLNRRQFIRTSGTLGAAFVVAGNSPWGQGNSPGESLNFACIGVGGKGGSDTRAAGRNGNVVALCDIDDNRLGAMAKEFPRARRFNDYREMLTAMGDDIDAVTVSTPDHTHAPASLMAMRLGKHCFCQKPLTWSLGEARLMRKTAKRMKVATQMGTQGTARDTFREAVEIVRSGAIGDVREVHVWSDRPIWPQDIDRPANTPPVPAHVHWDLFLGVAAERPYNPAYLPFNWRGWVDFGTGALGDMGAHGINLPFMALELADPVSVEATTSATEDASAGKSDDKSTITETFPKWSIVLYRFGSRDNLPPVTMTWYDGGKTPPKSLFMGEKIEKNGALLVGNQGTLLVLDGSGQKWRLLSHARFANYRKPSPSLPRSPGHFREWADACRGGPAPMVNFTYASRLTETTLLGNLAVRLGKRIEWDARAGKAKNAPQAAALINRTPREGWAI